MTGSRAYRVALERAKAFPAPHGERRRQRVTQRLLHCCCVCNNLAPWSNAWSWFGSYAEVDCGAPIMKFCSVACKKQRKAVTPEMAQEAREREYRQ